MAAQPGIQINQNIRVTRAEGEEDWYVSSVQDMNDNDFCISVPTRGPNPMVLNSGDSVKISFVSEMSRLEFETKVVGWRYDNIPLYVLALPKEYKRIQLREFVRIPVVLETYYSEIPEEGRQPVFIRCNSLDMSGGGIRLLLNKDYPANTRLMLKFTLPLKARPEEIEVLCRVVRSWPDQNTKLYQTAVQFVKISNRQQDSIVRFILMKMSEQKRLS